METSESERSPETEIDPRLGCLPLVGYGIVWIILFAFALSGLGTVVSEHLVEPRNQEGYGALLGIGGVFLFMPLGLLVSFALLLVLKRRWIFFVISVALPAAIAFGAALM